MGADTGRPGGSGCLVREQNRGFGTGAAADDSGADGGFLGQLAVRGDSDEGFGEDRLPEVFGTGDGGYEQCADGRHDPETVHCPGCGFGVLFSHRQGERRSGGIARIGHKFYQCRGNGTGNRPSGVSGAAVLLVFGIGHISVKVRQYGLH